MNPFPSSLLIPYRFALRRIEMNSGSEVGRVILNALLRAEHNMAD